MNDIKLSDVYATVEKWLYVPDRNLIDSVLATALSRKMKEQDSGSAIWLVLSGASSIGKTTLLRALKNGTTTTELPEITSKTLCTKFKGADPLAPQLHNKLVIFPEAGRLMNMHPVERRAIMGQLRDLYDGFSGRFTGADTQKDRELYTNLNVTMVWGTVPALEGTLIFDQVLGTRFLVYRCEIEKDDELLDMAQKNLRHEDQMRKELSEVMTTFIQQQEEKALWDQVEISDDIDFQLRSLAKTLTIMRASCQIDAYTQLPIGQAIREKPARVYKQFVRLYRCLMALDPNYSPEKALRIIKHIAFSSGERIRELILERFRNYYDSGDWVPTNDLANQIHLHYKPVRRELYILWQLGLLDKTEHTDDYNKQIEVWSLKGD